jgi:kynurenine formamidase
LFSWKREFASVAGIAALMLLGACAHARDWPQGRIVDLTHPFDEHTVYWPTAKRFTLEQEAEGVTEKGYYYFANQFSASEHGGTHVDAPRHFHSAGRTVDEIPLDQLMGKGVVVDVSEKCLYEADYEIQVEDFKRWEKRYGRIPERAIVLLRTGFGSFWPDRLRYMGTPETGTGAISKLHFPGLHPDAARWLAENRNVKAIGIDTPSIDYGQSVRYESHVALFERNVPAFENVGRLEELPPKGFRVVALPMKIKGGSGAPLRIVAVLD